MNEPTAASLNGSSPGAVLRRYFFATRPRFFPASALPVIAGTAWGAVYARRIDFVAAVLAMLATIAVHAASNVFNDVGDELNGTDVNNAKHIYPFTGGSRFIQNGVLTLEQMKRWAVALYAVGIVLGALLILHKGIGVLYLGLTGIALGMLYSLPVVQLSGRGVGEIAIAVAFGVLPVCGAAWLQSGVFDIAILLISIPISCWVAAILLINEVPDRVADKQAGKLTWPVRLGLAGTRWLYVSLHVIAAIASLLLVLQQVFPWWTLILPLALLTGGWRAGKTIINDDNAVLENGIKSTLAIHTAGALWLTIVILVTKL
ncbi:MAG: 1,4-dihydroxy-2-naphthoate octaprenyltransferase [Gammaproteobacteria bacterium]|nr:1,4-dihydroxy-2-naphthoate octaprenyltransferase [Gammaproteobacteria bacterium]